MPGNPYDGHTLAEALEQAAILSDVSPEVAIVDRGYKGVAIDGVKIYHPGLRRGITRGLRAMIRRRSALGDAMHAVQCGAGHNLRMIFRKLRFFLRPYAGLVVEHTRLKVPLVTQLAASKINCSGATT
jgi:IS5 family transposase